MFSSLMWSCGFISGVKIDFNATLIFNQSAISKNFEIYIEK
jgi:hypothetical protein